MNLEALRALSDGHARWGGEDLALVWVTFSAERSPRRAQIHAVTMAGDAVLVAVAPGFAGRHVRCMARMFTD